MLTPSTLPHNLVHHMEEIGERRAFGGSNVRFPATVRAGEERRRRRGTRDGRTNRPAPDATLRQIYPYAALPARSFGVEAAAVPVRRRCRSIYWRA